MRGDLKKHHLGLLIVALLLSWFAVEIHVTKGATIRSLLSEKTSSAYSQWMLTNNQSGILAAMFVGFMPFAIYLPQALWRFLIKCRNMVIADFGGWQRYKDRYSLSRPI
ncbi:MAG: hypothetical protein IPL73_19900 [Candidatus Obscuribacter sp.]|nr:hypothetical protein [Candidatus Obscuribacter sp.]